jgi:phosphoribosylamine--glycine ligase
VKILLVGGGGREHALAWKLTQSQQVSELVACPGNPGIASLARCSYVDVSDVQGVADLAVGERADLVVIGPEAPLALGLADLLRGRGIMTFGPVSASARLESSKAFAKEFMARHGIPTAKFRVVTSPEDALSAVGTWELPVVVKADGLAAGKGTVVCHTRDEAVEAIRSIMILRRFGSAGDRVVVEDCLEGEEASVLTLVGPGGHVTLPASQDYKRIYDGDRGPNTGGMGALCPLEMVDADLEERIEKEIVLPTLDGLAAEKLPFTGVLYSGLMLTKEGPQVMEFNCRMGDPESQAVLPAIEGDLASLMGRLTAGERVASNEVRWSGRHTLCTVMSSRGYPASSQRGVPIEGTHEAESLGDALVFQAGTRLGKGGRLETAGGRVLCVTGLGGSLAEARAKCHEALGLIEFDGAHYRRDIGERWLQPARKGESP